jgi:hypothetical protein
MTEVEAPVPATATVIYKKSGEELLAVEGRIRERER